MDINKASVNDIIESAKQKLNEHGIMKYSESKMPQVYEILSGYAEEIEAPEQLAEIISQDIPKAIEYGKSIQDDNLIKSLNEVSPFLTFNEETVKRQFEDESVIYGDNNYDDMPNSTDLSDIYSWGYAHEVDPDLTKEDYDKIAAALKNEEFGSDIVYSANYKITPELEKQIEDAVNNPKKFAAIRNCLFDKKLDWEDLVADDCSEQEPESLFRAVLNTDLDLIDAYPVIGDYINTQHAQDYAIIEAMKNAAE